MIPKSFAAPTKVRPLLGLSCSLEFKALAQVNKEWPQSNVFTKFITVQDERVQLFCQKMHFMMIWKALEGWFVIKKIIFQLKSQRLLNNRTLVLITNSGWLCYLGHKNIVRCKCVYRWQMRLGFIANRPSFWSYFQQSIWARWSKFRRCNIWIIDEVIAQTSSNSST